MTREAWGNIEEQPFRVDVGTSFNVAMSASVPAHVLCFTTDGRIVLNETVFGGASAIYINGKRYTSDITTGSVTLPMAEKGIDGLMYGADKVKLDTISEGAEPNVVTAVASDAQSVTITDKEDARHIAAARQWADTADTEISQIKDNATAIGHLVNANYSELKGNIVNLDSRIDSEKAYLEKKIDDNFTNLKKRVDANDSAIFEDGRKIEKLEEEQFDINIFLAKLQSQVDELRKQIGGITPSDIEMLKSLLNLNQTDE